MARVLVVWELGLNLGHLTRLLPVAKGLKSRGHTLLAAVRDLQSAAMVFGPAGIACVQAPCAQQQRQLHRALCSYADILLLQGWSERHALWGLVQGWLNLFRLFQPDIVLVDHSPTALLAARVAGLRRVLIGNGFEIPPATSPLPVFPGVTWASADQAADSERIALHGANAVLRAFGTMPLEGLRELFGAAPRLFATFAELDHYGARSNGEYLGPSLGGMEGERMEWPRRGGSRVFAYLRPEMDNIDAALAGLALSETNVICVAPGLSAARLDARGSSNIRFASRPVELAPLLARAQACVSYGAEGTVAAFLLAGVPQLLMPTYIESYLAARRVQELGAGVLLRGTQTAEMIATTLRRLVDDGRVTARAQFFAEKYRNFDPGRAADRAVELMESVVSDSIRNDSGRSKPLCA